MEEQKSHRKPFEDKIPSEAREHMRTAREEFRESFRALMPPEFMEHRRKARKEMLLAWRSLIDSALERMDKHDKESA